MASALPSGPGSDPADEADCPEAAGVNGAAGFAVPEAGTGVAEPPSSLLMARLTLSAIERASVDPSLWREPVLHQAVLVSGLSLLVGGLAQLQADLG